MSCCWAKAWERSGWLDMRLALLVWGVAGRRRAWPGPVKGRRATRPPWHPIPWPAEPAGSGRHSQRRLYCTANVRDDKAHSDYFQVVPEVFSAVRVIPL